MVSDRRAGRCVLGTLKGDFYLGKLAATGKVGVVEDWTKREYDDQSQGWEDLDPLRWSCVHIDPQEAAPWCSRRPKSPRSRAGASSLM